MLIFSERQHQLVLFITAAHLIILVQNSSPFYHLLNLLLKVLRIREASDIRNDSVTKLIKLVAADSDFYYHMSNKCYKKYTNSTLLHRFRQREELQNASPSSLGTSRTATRTQSTARSSPNPINTRSVMYQMNCIICHQRSHKREFNKSRISEDNRVTSFLEAANYFQDNVFGRVCDLQDEHAVFGADLYYHKHYMTIYLQKY